MESFKIENFKREYMRESFPLYRSLNAQELNNLQRKLFKKTSLNNSNNLNELVYYIQSNGTLINKYDASEDDFVLIDLISAKDIICKEKIFINWYQFDDVDEMKIINLSKYFDDIWYQGSDDIELFDKTLTWIISVRHDGIIYFQKI